MDEQYTIAIIGAGPGGLSAAARAAEMNASHVLLEGSAQIAKTIFQYQKGKHVMCEPGVIPLRSSIDFAAGKREHILDTWAQGVARHGVNIRYNATVSAISGGKGDFSITLTDGSLIQAQFIVLAIGVQGNLRQLNVPGDDAPIVQYQLDDPDEYFNEKIIVVGAGDAAIENALALAPHNDVVIVNRREEFARAKQGNLTAISKAIESGLLDCAFASSPQSVLRVDEDAKQYRISLKTSSGTAEFDCDRIIGRLGAIPPRQFLIDAGIEFPSDDPAAVPALSVRYESNVEGLYIIGALAGYPLIKQCMNQGHEVIEYIEGRAIEPIDQALLWTKLRHVPHVSGVDEAIDRIAVSAPILSGMTRLQIREFLLDSDIVSIEAGATIFERGDYSNSLFTIIEGTVAVKADDPEQQNKIEMHAGDFFGEMSLISGRRRSATIVAKSACVLLKRQSAR